MPTILRKEEGIVGINLCVACIEVNRKKKQNIKVANQGAGNKCGN